MTTEPLETVQVGSIEVAIQRLAAPLSMFSFPVDAPTVEIKVGRRYRDHHGRVVEIVAQNFDPCPRTGFSFSERPFEGRYVEDGRFVKAGDIIRVHGNGCQWLAHGTWADLIAEA